jgi:hypothetical protein
MISNEDGEFASPPCFMHELDPAFGMPVDRQQARDVARWRKVQRERLIAARLVLSAEKRTQHAQRIARILDGIGGGFSDRTLAAFDPKPLIVGVGHPLGVLTTIYPQWHDIRMDWIVTGNSAPRRTSQPGATSP